MISSARNVLMSIMLVAVLIFGFFATTSPSIARAETTTLIKHRDTSQIPTIRVWNAAKTNYVDLQRGETIGYFNAPFPIAWAYVPTGWCAETNVYYNGSFVAQNHTGPGPRWLDIDGSNGYHYLYSVLIHDPGADGICN